MTAEDSLVRNDTARRMADAAAALLASFTSDQRVKAVLDFEDAERENWHYIPRDRTGLPLKEMDSRQRSLTQNLVATGLSSAAHRRANTIIELEPVLGEIEGEGRKFARDPGLYYVTLFGTPGGGEAWGWRFEGHHISLNNTVLHGELISASPVFFGANPAEVRHGARQGLRALKEEEGRARALLTDLDGEQRREAVVAREAPSDILTRAVPHVRGEVKPEGLAGADMNAAQLRQLKDLVTVYVDRLPEAVAALEHARLEHADYAKAHFAWAGPAERGEGHYYRVQGPVFVAEYDNTQNDANHIHAVWRDLHNDFGEDLLKAHYREAH